MNAPESKRSFRYVGTRPVRPDGVEKVTGKAIYGPDYQAANMLHGAILRSPHAHARIRSVDTKKAEALTGVKAVVTGADFPSIEHMIMAVGESSSDIVHLSRNCMAHEKVLYDGHPVAAVAATSADIAREALELIDVDYEVLPHVLDIEEALAPDAPVLHDDIFTKGVNPPPDKPSNAAMRVEMGRGDVDKALAEADVTVTARYTSESVHQGYIEPHACVSSWDSDGQVRIWCSSQGHFAVRSLTAKILCMSEADIRVTPLEIGGGFGGKTTVYLEPVATVLSRKAGRPVRLAMTRTEVFRGSGPAPGAILDITMGAKKDGTITGVDLEFKYHAGAYPTITAHSGASSALAHLTIENSRVVGWEVLCNRPGTKAYRAPGAPQSVYAVECAIDELAEKLGMDKIDIRLKNAARPGDPNIMGMPQGEIGYVECLEAAKAHPHWSAPLGPNQGRGIAGGAWGNYGGPSSAEVSVAEDGSVLVTTGSPDIGGSRAAMAMMAAETLGIPYEKVRVAIGDTSSIGYSMVTGGSRTTFATGLAVTNAAKEVIENLKQRAASIWGVEAGEVEWRDGEAVCTKGEKKGERLSLGALAAQTSFMVGPITADSAVNPGGFLPGIGVHICDTELDPETGHARVVRYTAVQDVGQPIHPDYVEGQMQGGAVQGIGWALNEAYLYNDKGQLDNPGFLDYRVPVASDLPMIDTVMVEKFNPNHPYGIKGVGEAPIVPPLAAVANSVSQAAGVRLRALPLSPDRVYEAMHPDD
jgi:CO/xanthine dehydrogenase Mo-binding subunit